jgi:hypothetical protein
MSTWVDNLYVLDMFSYKYDGASKVGHLLKNWYRLSPTHTPTGVSCSKDGVFVGEVPLLKRTRVPGGTDQWQPRDLHDINSDLSKRFGLPIEFGQKIAGLKVVTHAIGRDDIARAQFATLHLQIPEPPSLTKSARTTSEVVDLARRLHASGLLKLDWDPEKHPRWPAGSSGGVGGEFAPAGSEAENSTSEDSGAALIPAQFEIPMEIPFPRIFPLPRTLPRVGPLPSEIVPPPTMVSPREQPRNPYPRRAKCVKEWDEAEDYCDQLIKEGKLGKEPQRGQGQWRYQCILGRVSEDCGGNSTSAYEIIA